MNSCKSIAYAHACTICISNGLSIQRMNSSQSIVRGAAIVEDSSMHTQAGCDVGAVWPVCCMVPLPVCSCASQHCKTENSIFFAICAHKLLNFLGQGSRFNLIIGRVIEVGVTNHHRRCSATLRMNGKYPGIQVEIEC